MVRNLLQPLVAGAGAGLETAPPPAGEATARNCARAGVTAWDAPRLGGAWLAAGPAAPEDETGPPCAGAARAVYTTNIVSHQLHCCWQSESGRYRFDARNKLNSTTQHAAFMNAS